MELRFRGRVVVIVCYRFCFYTPTLQHIGFSLLKNPFLFMFNQQIFFESTFLWRKNKLSIKTFQEQIWTIFTLYRIIDRNITNPLKLQNLKTQIQTIPCLLVLLFVLKLGLLQKVPLHLQTHKRKENENENQIIYGDQIAKLRI